MNKWWDIIKYKDIETNNIPLISFKNDFDKIVNNKNNLLEYLYKYILINYYNQYQ